MSKKRKEEAMVLSQTVLAPGIYDMWISTGLAKDVKAGQFIGVYTGDGTKFLPRPISICQVNEDKSALRIVYRKAGAGTAIFSTWHSGKKMQILGILGNGFPVNNLEGKRVTLMGGGIGIPPMLELAATLNKQGITVNVIAGYRDENLFLKEDLERFAPVLIATEDGSVGIKGNVLTVMEQEKVETDVIMACGPMPMLRAIKAYALERQITAYISLEERMACGVGVCLGCVCKTKEKNLHSHVNNTRICTEGPVFNAQEVDI